MTRLVCFYGMYICTSIPLICIVLHLDKSDLWVCALLGRKREWGGGGGEKRKLFEDISCTFSHITQLASCVYNSIHYR